MTPALARDALEGMKRVDIQKLCKTYGVKANLKTDALIQLLLDASQPQAPRRNPPQAPNRPPSTRIPSLTGARSRQQSAGSVITHGSEDESDPIIQRPHNPHNPISHEQPTPQRTRKAKQTQYRLGVGRPVVAGGSGARAITKSVGIPRTPKRSRSSKSIHPTETTITEEPELISSLETRGRTKKNPEHVIDQLQLNMRSVPGPSNRVLEIAIAEALVPVQRELDSHKTQLANLTEKVSSLVESFETKIRNLTSEIQELCARLKNSSPLDTIQECSVRALEPPSTPKRVRTPYLPPFALPTTENSGPSDLSSDPSNPDVLVSADLRPDHDMERPRQMGSLLPGFPHSTLGKRPRDSISSSNSEVLEPIQEDMEAEKGGDVGRPAHKRARLELEDRSRQVPSSSEPSSAEPSDPAETSQRRGGPSFPVFSGEEEDPPPIERLPNFYAPTSPLMDVPATSSAHNVENQNPFSFSFVPIASTPVQPLYPLTMGTFPHPEPPTSPSPAVNPDRPGSRHSDRFGAFGVPRSSSRASGRAASGGSMTRAEASGSGGLHRAPSSNEVASGLGLTAIKTSATEQGTPAPPAKRTMYGTELDGDTRFGDFGVEGVASGFWAGGRF